MADDAPQIIRIPIRPGVEVAVQYPLDLTRPEAEKVARVIVAFADLQK